GHRCPPARIIWWPRGYDGLPRRAVTTLQVALRSSSVSPPKLVWGEAPATPRPPSCWRTVPGGWGTLPKSLPPWLGRWESTSPFSSLQEPPSAPIGGTGSSA